MLGNNYKMAVLMLGMYKCQFLTPLLPLNYTQYTSSTNHYELLVSQRWRKFFHSKMCEAKKFQFS